MHSRLNSLKYAFTGIHTALKDQPNLMIHCLIASMVILLASILDITKPDWLALIIVIGLVITLELTNTAIEEVVNSFTDQVHPAAKKAKDVAAGAVLISTFTAIIIGLVVFLPYFIVLFPYLLK